MALVFGRVFVALEVQASFGFALRTRVVCPASVGDAARISRERDWIEGDAVASSAIC